MGSTDISWTSNKNGSSTLNIRDYGNSETKISADGKATSVTNDVFGQKDGTPIDPIKALSKLGENFSAQQPIEIDTVRTIIFRFITLLKIASRHFASRLKLGLLRHTKNPFNKSVLANALKTRRCHTFSW